MDEKDKTSESKESGSDDVLLNALEQLKTDLKEVIKKLPNGAELIKQINSNPEFEFDIKTYKLDDADASEKKFLDPTVLVKPENGLKYIKEGRYVNANEADYGTNAIFALWNAAQRTATVLNTGIGWRLPYLPGDVSFMTTNLSYLDGKGIPKVINQNTYEIAKHARKFFETLISNPNAFAIIPDKPKKIKNLKDKAIGRLQDRLDELVKRIEQYEAMTEERQPYIHKMEDIVNSHKAISKELYKPFADYKNELNQLNQKIFDLTRDFTSSVQESLKQIPELNDALRTALATAQNLESQQMKISSQLKIASEGVKELSLPTKVYYYTPKAGKDELRNRAILENSLLDNDRFFYNLAIKEHDIQDEVVEAYSDNSNRVEMFSAEKSQRSINHLQEKLDEAEKNLKLALIWENYLSKHVDNVVTDLNEYDRSLGGILELDEEKFPSNAKLPEDIKKQDISKQNKQELESYEQSLIHSLQDLSLMQDKITQAEKFYKKKLPEITTALDHLQKDVINLESDNILPESLNIKTDNIQSFKDMFFKIAIRPPIRLQKEMRDSQTMVDTLNIINKTVDEKIKSVNKQINDIQLEKEFREALTNAPEQQAKLTNLETTQRSLFDNEMKLNQTYNELLDKQRQIKQARYDLKLKNNTQNDSLISQILKTEKEIQENENKIQQKLTERNTQIKILENLVGTISKDQRQYLVIDEKTRKELSTAMEWDENKTKSWTDIFKQENQYESTPRYYYMVFSRYASSIFEGATETNKEILLAQMNTKISSLKEIFTQETDVSELRNQVEKLQDQAKQLQSSIIKVKENYESLVHNLDESMNDNENRQQEILKQIDSNKEEQKDKLKKVQTLSKTIASYRITESESALHTISKTIEELNEQLNKDYLIPGFSNQGKLEDKEKWEKWLEQPNAIQQFSEKLIGLNKELEDKDFSMQLYQIEDNLKKIRNFPDSKKYFSVKEKLAQIRSELSTLKEALQKRAELIPLSKNQVEINKKKKEAEKEHKQERLDDRIDLFYKYFLNRGSKKPLVGDYLAKRSQRFAIKDFFSGIIAFVSRNWNYKTDTQLRADFFNNEVMPAFIKYVHTGQSDVLDEIIKKGLERFPTRMSQSDPSFLYTMQHLLNSMQHDIELEKFISAQAKHKEVAEEAEKPALSPQPHKPFRH